MSGNRPIFARHVVLLIGVIWLASLATHDGIQAHDHSAAKAEKQRRDADTRAAAQAEAPNPADEVQTCQLTVRLRDTEGEPLPGLIRITNLATGKMVSLTRKIHRNLNWHSVRATATVTVPRSKLRIEAIHGLTTERSTTELDLIGKGEASIELTLVRFYDPKRQGLFAGNTHLHLMKMSYLDALQYLEVVPRSDGLDVAFLSHLRRIPDERDYVSNQIVENSFAGGDLQRLSQQGVLFGTGEEHRHNFGRMGEGFGHVMLLDLKRLIHPVSIGPGIMEQGTDGRPLRLGIQSARGDGATAIWCHNTFGFEDLPNWTAKLLDAQNIFDGGEHGSYRDTYYRYLNVGWRVPFSTGTDWFIYDFSRVYVPVGAPMTSQTWLSSLRAGKSYITNGPLLEFTVNDRPIGDTIQLDGPASVHVRGKAIGRNDFRGVELIHNGNVIQPTASRAVKGHFTAELTLKLDITEPGWLALRIPLAAGKNELDQPLFAHTSPIYIELAGKHIFQTEVAQQLIAEIQQSIVAINDQAKFASDQERESVLRVYHDAIDELRRMMR